MLLIWRFLITCREEIPSEFRTVFAAVFRAQFLAALGLSAINAQCFDGSSLVTVTNPETNRKL